MAVWQYKGGFVPELWLIAEYGRIPRVLEDYLHEDEGELLDPPQWWKDFETPSKLIERVQAILPPNASWAKNAVMFGDTESDDLAIWYENGELESIAFRLDIRKLDLEIANQLAALARELGCYFVSGDRATLVEPNLPSLIRDIHRTGRILRTSLMSIPCSKSRANRIPVEVTKN